jgi:tryptophan synthase alpha subunit
MPAAAQIIYQPYVTGARGALKPGIAVVCRTAEEGVRRAEKALAGGSIVGARIVRVLHDNDADEFGLPEYLSELGQVPEEA